MAALRRGGWSEAVTVARLAQLADRRLALALLPRVPAADGSDGRIPLDERTPHVLVTYGPPTHDPNTLGYPSDWYSEPQTPDGLVRIPVAGNPDLPGYDDYQAWAVVDADTGEVLYVGIKHTQLKPGKLLVLPRTTFRVLAEMPSG
jgi:hypothetical protein